MSWQVKEKVKRWIQQLESLIVEDENLILVMSKHENDKKSWKMYCPDMTYKGWEAILLFYSDRPDWKRKYTIFSYIGIVRWNCNNMRKWYIKWLW